jgi:hypothetical protein
MKWMRKQSAKIELEKSYLTSETLGDSDVFEFYINNCFSNNNNKLILLFYKRLE